MPKTEPAKPPAIKPTEKAPNPVKPIDPWEEARAYFKLAKEMDKEATEAKLKKLDKQAEAAAKLMIGPESRLDVGKFPTTCGKELWALGFTEYVAARSAGTLDDNQFRAVFAKLNPKPTSEEIVNAVIRYSITYYGLRDLTADMIEKGEDTRDRPDTHRTATAWTGK